ncbi:E3 ubiquitin-protein ligase At4g11680-like [Pyrus communis]|uniref:E3 ubiquitin-protein ligase At4g11680-like n=1 Tax=Pyrus communis TaxID=23211 RepID=UPI0035BED62C
MNSVDTHPLIGYSIGDELFQNRRLMRHGPPPLRGAMRILSRVSGRQMRLREPSVRVRENALEELEERQNFWAYSKPTIILDLLWNLVFVIVGFSVLGLSVEEKPLVPLRIWVVGYILLCVVHVGCVVAQYQRRREEGEAGSGEVGWGSIGSESSGSGGNVGGYGGEHGLADDDTSVTTSLESAISMFSFIWWSIGFYWVLNGGQTLLSSSPRLYWLCVSFLVFDVTFIIVCVAASCLVGIAICCFLPCIIGILCAVTDQDGATEEEIDGLPKFKFRRVGDSEKVNGEVQAFEGFMVECDTNAPTERPISLVDAECCICLSVYENGAELRELPCLHHFHCTCIDKWLHINAICPMCKFNILKPHDRREIGQV